MANTKQHNIIVEENAVDNLKIWLRTSKQIIPDIKANDKTAFVDGNIKLLTSGSNTTIGTLEVQVKGTSKSITHSENPVYSVERSFLEHCKSQKLPIVLIVVYNNEIAFWMHMDRLKCETYLNKMTAIQKTITIYFEKTHYIQKNHTTHCVTEFTKILNNQAIILDDYDVKCQRVQQLENAIQELNKYKNTSIGKTSPKYKEIHLFLDCYNNLLDNDFSSLKNAIYPNYWKIGIGICHYSDNAANYVFYPISYELNDVQIKEFEQNDSIMQKYNNETIIQQKVYFSENPIKTRHQQFAYECIKSNLITGVFGKLKIPVLVKDFFLATEFLFDFIDKYHSMIKFQRGQYSYSLTEIINSINTYLPNTNDICLFPSTETVSINTVTELIQFLQSMDIKEVNRGNYFGLLTFEFNNIISIRQRFYEIIPKVYDLLVKMHFPNLFHELQFFNDFNLMLIAFDFSDESKSYGGIGTEFHYYLKAVSQTAGKVISYNSVDECPIKPYPVDFNALFDINGIKYQLQKCNNIQINRCERAPLLSSMHDLLKYRLISYLDTKINSGGITL